MSVAGASSSLRLLPAGVSSVLFDAPAVACPAVVARGPFATAFRLSVTRSCSSEHTTAWLIPPAPAIATFGR
ncbi:hypothetical protein PYCCODRAFT_1431164 [Trametes coccinea BRFM310]|uniref:Uncharacterized protein n=1 Tax=Trametes coccinea (strain BRFM310) TaxID=1353009 RepID=A0A1Y2J0N5_TRAC3|nr:hypothetical protein PYCCODRAFT_1431164 [Trametes coccinea BRFM310]